MNAPQRETPQEPRRISAAMAKYTFSEIVDRARQFGETVIIQRYGRDSAAIVPLEALKGKSTKGK